MIPSSPQSQIFEKYLNHEIAGCLGLPELEIPLYEIKLKDITIPLTLSYNASGVKYMQYDGDIGAGWSIGAAGYRVSRTVKGADDLGIIESCGYSPSNYLKLKNHDDLLKKGEDVRLKDGLLLGVSFDPNGYPRTILGNAFGAFSALELGDSQYDKFSYMLPTTGGKFIITDRVNKTIAHLDEKQDLIDILSRKEMKITDDSGIEYLLGGTDAKNMNLTEEEKRSKHETGWVLREIRTPSGESVRFDYTKAMIRSYRYRENIIGLTVEEASVLKGKYPTFFNNCVMPAVDEVEINQVYNGDVPIYDYLLFLSRIETDNVSIAFERVGLLDMGHSVSTFSDYVLKKITITDKRTQKVVKEIVLNNKVIPDEIDTYDRYCSTPSHLVLNAVSVADKNYKMEYYAPPSNYTYGYPDQWNNYSFNLKYARYGQKNFLHKQFQNDLLIWKMHFWNIPENTITTTLGTYTYWQYYFADRSADDEYGRSFSLRKITYPTGGTSEYVYEPHQAQWEKGGGLRVKRIISRSDPDRPAIISEFRYGTGYPSLELDHTAFYDISYTMNHERVVWFNGAIGDNEWYARIRRTRYYSINPTGDFSLSDFNVYYPHVDILQYDELSNKYNGRKSLEYNLPSFPHIGYYDGFYLKCSYPLEDDSRYSRGIYRVCNGQKPTMKSVSYYDDTDKLLQQETCEYIKTNEQEYKGLKVRRRISGYNSEIPLYPEHMSPAPTNGDRNDYNYISSYFDYMEHVIESGAYLLSSKTKTLFTPEGEFSTTERYDYNAKNQVCRIELKNKDIIISIKELNYPQDYAFGYNIYRQMVFKNVLSPVVSQVHYTGDNREIKRIKTEYDGSWNAGGFRPSAVKTTSEGVLRTEITYDQYDSRGNLRQYTTPDGISTVFLWSYNYQYPIAEIRNTTCSEVERALSAQGKSVEQVAGSELPDVSADALREALPDALVTFYTYAPLVGITGITDPRGVKCTYHYDEFNRLKYIEDDENNRIRQFEYNYRSNL